MVDKTTDNAKNAKMQGKSSAVNKSMGYLRHNSNIALNQKNAN